MSPLCLLKEFVISDPLLEPIGSETLPLCGAVPRLQLVHVSLSLFLDEVGLEREPVPAFPNITGGTLWAEILEVVGKFSGADGLGDEMPSLPVRAGEVEFPAGEAGVPVLGSRELPTERPKFFGGSELHTSLRLCSVQAQWPSLVL